MIKVTFVLVLSLIVSPVFANEVDGIDDNDHAALAKHYEKLANEAKAKLQENKAVLEEYEVHPYYYGRQGQDLQSHTSANIHEYEETLKENRDNANLHKRMIVEQDDPVNKAPVNKAKINLDRDSITVK